MAYLALPGLPLVGPVATVAYSVVDPGGWDGEGVVALVFAVKLSARASSCAGFIRAVLKGENSTIIEHLLRGHICSDYLHHLPKMKEEIA